MSDYTELVKALRCKRDDCEGCDLSFFDKDEGWMCQYAAKDDDAAAAIEELDAEETRLLLITSELQDKVVELEEELNDADVAADDNARQVEELQAEVERLQAQLPKRGEWVEENRRPRSSQFICSECHRTAYDPQPTRDKAWRKRCRYAYCPNCGAKMNGEQNVE